MGRTRREFLLTGAVGAAGSALACTSSSPGSNNPTTSTFQAVLQFSGLILHGSWPAKDPSQPSVFSGWDSLLVRDVNGYHQAALRVPLANVKDPAPFSKDPYFSGLGVMYIPNTDVVVNVGGVTGGPVTAVTGSRPPGAACPDPKNDNQYSDISWLADFDLLLATVTNKGALQDSLKNGSKDIKKDDLVNARVRLSTGQVACSRPSTHSYDNIRIDFSTLSSGQFCTDLVRYTTPASDQISLELIPFGSTSGTTIQLVSNGSSPVYVYVENDDPALADRVLKGTINGGNFWAYHFEPHFRLLKATFSGLTATPNCCNGGCDPPFYCFETRGYFRP